MLHVISLTGILKEGDLIAMKRKKNLSKYSIAGVILLLLMSVILAGCSDSMSQTSRSAVTDDKHVEKLVVGYKGEVTDLNFFDDTLCYLAWFFSDYSLVGRERLYGWY